MSGKSKARREAKGADRAARSNQRAQADLQRRWHLTLAQSRQVDSTYSQAAIEAAQRATMLEAVRTAARKLDEGNAEAVAPVFHPADLPDRLRAAAALMDAQPVPTEDRALYEPHCVMEWREQMAGMDDMGGVDTALARGDAT